MAIKSTGAPERIGRVGQRRQVVIPREILETLNIREGDFVSFAEQKNGVLIKPRATDPDDVLTVAESALVKKAEREMKQGKFITLAQLRHDLDRSHSRRRRKTA